MKMRMNEKRLYKKNIVKNQNIIAYSSCSEWICLNKLREDWTTV